MYETVVGQSGMGSVSVISYVDAVEPDAVLSPSERGGGEGRRRRETTSGFSEIIRVWLCRALRARLAVMGGGSVVVVVVVWLEWRSGIGRY